MSLPEVIKAALDQIHTIARTETVIGEPIIAGNVTLIPVSRVSIGFAAGGGNENKAGSGTGGGVSVTPIAFISIIDGKVGVHSVDKEEPGIGKLLAMAPDLIGKIAKFVGKKDKDKPSDESK